MHLLHLSAELMSTLLVPMEVINFLKRFRVLNSGELLTLQGVGKQQVGEAINLLVSCRSQLDRRLFWRTLGLNPPTQREVGQITGRVERTIVRKASKTADPVTEATKPPKSTPAEPFNPALPTKVDVSQALLGLARRSK